MNLQFLLHNPESCGTVKEQREIGPHVRGMGANNIVGSGSLNCGHPGQETVHYHTNILPVHKFPWWKGKKIGNG